MCENTFKIYHDLYGEGKHRHTKLRNDSMMDVKFVNRSGPAWGIWSKPSHFFRRVCLGGGTAGRGVFKPFSDLGACLKRVHRYWSIYFVGIRLKVIHTAIFLESTWALCESVTVRGLKIKSINSLKKRVFIYTLAVMALLYLQRELLNETVLSCSVEQSVPFALPSNTKYYSITR